VLARTVHIDSLTADRIVRCKGDLSIMSRNNKGFTIVELMVAAAVLAIILAAAIPYYASYRRAACDRVAEHDLMNLLPAWEKYCNDESNPLNEPPYTLSDLAGDYYGWGGTTEACRVRVSYDRESRTVYAASLNGSHPRGVGTYYKYKLLMPATDSRAALSVKPTYSLAMVLHKFERVFEPGSAFAKQTDAKNVEANNENANNDKSNNGKSNDDKSNNGKSNNDKSNNGNAYGKAKDTGPKEAPINVPTEPEPEKPAVVGAVEATPERIGFVTEPELAAWYPCPAEFGCKISAHNPDTYKYRGCNQ
jgi:type IV pilus assembly protein PilA